MLKLIKMPIFGTLILFLLFLNGNVSAAPLNANASLETQGQGVNFTSVGAGLQDSGSGTINVSITGPVVSATLYWIGRARNGTTGLCNVAVPPGGPDDELLFAGIPVTADRLTGCEENEDIDNIGYAADVTDIVSDAGTGNISFPVMDNDPEDLFRLNGAGLLVIYTDPGDTNFYKISVYDGLDFAYYGSFPFPEATVTSPITFTHTAEAFDRTAEIGIFAADGEAGRPDRVQINTDSLLNTLDGNAGPTFDDDVYSADIPAGSTETTIQMFSEPNVLLQDNPDSLAWELAAIRVPENAVNGRMTGGRNLRVNGAQVKGSKGGFTIHCDITLSNNVQVTWKGGNSWHLDKPITSAICIDDPIFNPTPPAAPFDTFIGEGIGKLNGVDGSVIKFTFIDDGEPGRGDYIDINIWAPGDDPNVDPAHYSVSGFLDGGNIQAHYDQPHK